MFKSFLVGSIIISLIGAFTLYGYGKNTVDHMFLASKNSYNENSSVSEPILEGWIDYIPASKSFISKFPTLPQHATDRALDSKTKESKQYEMYVSENNDHVFMISVISFLDVNKIRDGEKVLKKVVDDMVVSNPGNRLEKFQQGSLEDIKNVEFLITNESYTIKGHAFLAKNKLYVLSVLSKSVAEPSAEFEYFFKSFKINNDNSSNLLSFSMKN
ncbi:hypothetical protein NEOC84_001581|uniref:hypothetical protein n=1 Tax=Neochlamydia sp. AcF84 TaxID=2315858 RepID=UPI00140E0073|nr:hypothetical protein [Neochlamydia sp. AcF84]NGY95657.1 hypothetical protein [Neochlamydia sp. AcF84]